MSHQIGSRTPWRDTYVGFCQYNEDQEEDEDQPFKSGEPDLKFPLMSDKGRAHSCGWSPGGAAFTAASSSVVGWWFSSFVARNCCSASSIIYCFGSSKLQPSATRYYLGRPITHKRTCGHRKITVRFDV